MGMNLHLESFLEMMAVERGASANTLSSYRRDLQDFAQNTKTDATTCNNEDIIKYMQTLGERAFSTRTMARRLSSLNQFFKYLYLEKIRNDNP